jgi:hypothetical protein
MSSLIEGISRGTTKFPVSEQLEAKTARASKFAKLKKDKS